MFPVVLDEVARVKDALLWRLLLRRPGTTGWGGGVGGGRGGVDAVARFVLVVEAGVEAGAEGVEDDSLVVAAASFGVGVGRGTGIFTI